MINPIISSSVGASLRIGSGSLNLGAGLGNIGVSAALLWNNTNYSLGIRLNLAECKIGIEFSSSVQYNNSIDSSFVNLSINGFAVVMAFLLVMYGYSASPEPVPQY